MSKIIFYITIKQQTFITKVVKVLFISAKSNNFPMNHIADLMLRIIFNILFRVKQPFPKMTSAAKRQHLVFSSLIRGFLVTRQGNIILIEGGFLGSALDHLKYNMKYDGAGEIMQPDQSEKACCSSVKYGNFNLM